RLLVLGLVASAGTLALAAIGSCDNGSGNSAASADGASDAADESEVLEAGATDAADDLDHDPDVYPASHGPGPQIDFLGGPVLDPPRLVTITFAGDPLRDELRAYADALARSSDFRASLAEYGVGDATNGGAVELPDDLSGALVKDEDIQAMLAQRIATGAVP